MRSGMLTLFPKCSTHRHLTAELELHTDLPVEAWDERLSTAEGEARLRGAGLDRKARARRKDLAAAIVILETYLGRHPGGV